MSEIFLTSDTHFSHNQPFLYEPRGFTSVEEMNEAIVERWNSIVKPEDTVYHLGDMALGDISNACEYIKRLNGKIFWIRGNHCTENKIQYIMDSCWDKIFCMGWAHVIKHHKMSIYLSHYPTITSNFDEKHFSQHVINLHGHTHQQTNWLQPQNPFMYHIGMDSHNCTPVHIDEVISDIRQKWNSIGKESV